MALRDHFHPPLSVWRHWHSFHQGWAMYLAEELNRVLPENYFAEPNVQFRIEVDVAAFETVPFARNLSVAIAPAPMPSPWTPPASAQTIPFEAVTDSAEINIINTDAGPVLAGVIELVSPANKDRAEHREAVVSKCETYLQQGLGLIIVDIVTTRRANLHNELIARLAPTVAAEWSEKLYATAYRVAGSNGQGQVEIWREGLQLGASLPTLPLWLRDEICVPVDLNSTYEHTCQAQRIPA